MYTNYPTSSSTPPEQPPRRSRPLGIVALVFLIIATASLVVANWLDSKSIELYNQRQGLSTNSMMTPDDGITNVDLIGGTQYIIAGSSIISQGTIHAEATDPQGNPLALTIADPEKIRGGWIVYEFTAPSTGTYQFTVGGGGVLVSSAIYSAEARTVDTAETLCFALTVIAGLAGLILGITWLARRIPNSRVPAWKVSDGSANPPPPTFPTLAGPGA